MEFSRAMRFSRVVGLAGFASLTLLSPAHAEVRLSIQDGRVSLVATNATVREILAEWARVGQTRIVNGERVTGAPLSLQLDGVTEDRALDVILRSVSGYVAAPRPVYVANASRYDRILVMPTSSPPRNTPAAPPPFSQQQPRFVPPQPRFVPPQPQPGFQPPAESDEDPEPPVAMPAPRGPVFQTPFETPQPSPNDGAAPAPGPAPSAPAGVSRPGMIVPVPQPPPGSPPIPQPGQRPQE